MYHVLYTFALGNVLRQVFLFENNLSCINISVTHSGFPKSSMHWNLDVSWFVKVFLSLAEFDKRSLNYEKWSLHGHRSSWYQATECGNQILHKCFASKMTWNTHRWIYNMCKRRSYINLLKLSTENRRHMFTRILRKVSSFIICAADVC